MQAVLSTAIEQWQAQSPWEVAAVLLAIAYLWLAIRQSIWCWPCAAISTAIYVALFVEARLYMESLLNSFYFAMAVYGWFAWQSGSREGSLPVTSWPLRRHLLAVPVILMLSAISGSLLSRFFDAAFPYVDSFTTLAALWATYLIARKVLENWWYWLVIDALSIVIFWQRGLELTALLFVLYVGMIPMGYLSWRRSLERTVAGAPA